MVNILLFDYDCAKFYINCNNCKFIYMNLKRCLAKEEIIYYFRKKTNKEKINFEFKESIWNFTKNQIISWKKTNKHWFCICSVDENKNCCVHIFSGKFFSLMNYKWLSNDEKIAFCHRLFERYLYTLFEVDEYICAKVFLNWLWFIFIFF